MKIRHFYPVVGLLTLMLANLVAPELNAQPFLHPAASEEIVPENEHFVSPEDWDFDTTDPHSTSMPRFVGTAACVECHKDGHRYPEHSVAGREYDVWAERDPHSCAYATLFKPKSIEIARKLNLQRPPHQSNLCLNCHSTNVPDDQLVHRHKHTIADGVGCESCHGGAADWLVAHKLPGWKNCSPEEKRLLGFNDTSNVAIRARTCVQCHVGAPGRDVNHDLIAAGHPRLYFELASYQANMPRHWSRANSLAREGAQAETRRWLVGQVVSASASLELLRHRASDHSAPWPEFGEFGCFSCHHDLADQQFQDNPFHFENASKPKWRSWHLSPSFDTAAKNLLADSDDFLAKIQGLRSEMESQMADREAIGPFAEQLKVPLQDLAQYLASAPLSDEDASSLAYQFSQLAHTPEQPRNRSWDALTQRYLATVALMQSRQDSSAVLIDPQFFPLVPQFQPAQMKLREIRDTLKFIKNHDGPRHLDAVKQERLDQLFDELLNNL